jgi:hypothetical protein
MGKKSVRIVDPIIHKRRGRKTTENGIDVLRAVNSSRTK